MAINFPNNPSVNDTFTVGGTTFTFTGVKWETSAVVELSSDITPTLGGDLDAATHNINNVGIITATGLDINGDADISGNLTVQGTTTTIDTAVTEVDSLAVDGNITAGGSVGIGTDNPETKLNIVGSTASASSTGGTLGIRQKGNTNNDGITLTSSHINSARFWKDSDGKLHIYNTGTGSNQFVLDNAGKVGIGTDNPARALHTRSDLVRFDNDAPAGIILVDHQHNKNFRIVTNTSNSHSFSIEDMGTSVSGAGTARLTIDGSGNVNIGVNDSSNPFTHLRFGASQYGAADIRPTDDGSHKVGLAFYVDGTQDTTINPTEALRVTSDGRIGIATDNPNSMGRVSIVVPSTGGHGAINIQNPEVGAGKTNIVFRSLDNNGGNWADAELRAEGYSFKIRTTERFRIDFDGTVSDSMGPLRRLGIQGASGSFSFAADMAGKFVRSTGNGSTLTIPQNVFSAGDMITVFNVSTGNNTIGEGTGITLYNTADGATGNRTLGAKGVCTILCTSNNEFIISGSQVS